MRVRSWRNLIPLLRFLWVSGRGLVLAVLVLRLIRSALPLLLLWIPKLILDAVIRLSVHHEGSAARIWELIGIELGLAIANDMLTRVNTLCDSLLGDRFSNRINLELMRHASQLDLASFEDPVFYDQLARARDQTGGRLALFNSLLNVYQDGFTVVILSTSFFVFSPLLIVLLCIAVVPSLLGEGHLVTLAYSLLYRITPERRQLDYLRWLATSSQTVKEIKLFGLHEHLERFYEKTSTAIYRENSKMSSKRAIMGGLLNLISMGGYYSGYAILLFRTIAGAISIGTLTFLTGGFSKARACLERITDNLNDISEQMVFLNDLFEFFKMQPSICSPPHARTVPRVIRQGIEFRNVSFAYPGADHFALRNVSFRLRPGEKLALVGENGAGKTTVVKLVTRLYDPLSGQILLDGVDLREYDLDDLRDHIGVIFQDYVQYEMQVRDNIGFGDVDFLSDEKRIQSAAMKSGAHEFIQHLPQEYSQLLGRRFAGGMGLSGGEWQKIALARAYMKDAKLLILDEPTASLDARAEYEVFCHFTNLMHNRMAMLISHRFSTVRMANRILVLADGIIQEAGTHNELLALAGRYAELFELQASGYR